MMQALDDVATTNILDSRGREASFREWPHSNIPTGPLVVAGFSYTNSGSSTVKCIACGLEVDASSLNGTNPYVFHVLRSPECSFFYPANPYRRESDRRQTFLYWIGYDGAPDVDDLVSAGFYVAEFGEDKLRCFCCDLNILSPNQTAELRQEHARLSPNCVFIRNWMLQESNGRGR
ncbi:baculoviral IAP repeat-containing protein 2-like [Pecten maximus]|uniref:baculoviral IAP repeat-containing protein 2-like n=1 Tax=Pecten maximus TaxID=6579 RepID=UPI001457EBE8|nr:baculoviral IAP repeat-containing protein 2-like [Pecten maximus]